MPIKIRGTKKCLIAGCKRLNWSKGICDTCYKRIRRQASPILKEKHRLKSARNRKQKKWKEYSRRWVFEWRRTKKGFLMARYGQMSGRVRGIGKAKGSTYDGLSICSRDEFILWSMKDNNFKKLWDRYRHTIGERKTCPSVDRINNSVGYIMGNMQWITVSENSSKQDA